MKSLRESIISELDTASLDIAICDAEKVVDKVFDFEQIFNIHEGT